MGVIIVHAYVHLLPTGEALRILWCVFGPALGNAQRIRRLTTINPAVLITSSGETEEGGLLCHPCVVRDTCPKAKRGVSRGCRSYVHARELIAGKSAQLLRYFFSMEVGYRAVQGFQRGAVIHGRFSLGFRLKPMHHTVGGLVLR